jgi:hypothetical protein
MHVSIYIILRLEELLHMFFFEQMAFISGKVGIAFAVLIVRFRGPKIFATFDEDNKRAKDGGQRLGEEDALVLPLCASSSLPEQAEALSKKRSFSKWLGLLHKLHCRAAP